MGWKVWGNAETERLIDANLIQLYCRIFSVHIEKDMMKIWEELDMEQMEIASKYIVDILSLPLSKDIRYMMETKLKWKSRKNSILGRIPSNEHDRVVGFL